MPPTDQPVSSSKASPEATPFHGIEGLEALLAHSFHDKTLLARAVTHSSLAYERTSADQRKINVTKSWLTAPDEADNEQLEFLGDAVVGLLVAESLCRKCSTLAEGQLTRLRAALVSRSHLGKVAALLNLGQYLRLGRGEERSGGRKKNAILANCIEAVMGALYSDAGLESVRTFVERDIVAPYLPDLLEQMERGSTIGDHKSALQELLQAKRLGPPLYTVKSETGPDHLKRFVVEVRIPGSDSPIDSVASGTGPTKKKAEQEAARRAFKKIQTTPQTSGSSLQPPGPQS